MRPTDYDALYKKAYKIMGELTPLKADCGQLCDRACCKGDDACGMLLFPNEPSSLPTRQNEEGELIAVCDGTCDRNSRPLACRIFPFFPTVDQKGRVFVEPDYRAKRLCPMIDHGDEILFDPRFFKAVKKVGKLLVKDQKCFDFMLKATEEIDIYYNLLCDKD